MNLFLNHKGTYSLALNSLTYRRTHGSSPSSYEVYPQWCWNPKMGVLYLRQTGKNLVSPTLHFESIFSVSIGTYLTGLQAVFMVSHTTLEVRIEFKLLPSQFLLWICSGDPKGHPKPDPNTSWGGMIFFFGIIQLKMLSTDFNSL